MVTVPISNSPRRRRFRWSVSPTAALMAKTARCSTASTPQAVRIFRAPCSMGSSCCSWRSAISRPRRTT